ncbi:MAG TPA: SAM-dependent methyltransferase [Trebonia sp.]|nr:SAM-dependent methyltransferase [Trebonia sp.]
MTDTADWGVAKGVGFTALAAAGLRAVETLRAPALFSDPFAAAFVRAASAPVPIPVTPEAADGDTTFPWSVTGTYVAVRTRYFDQYMTRAAADGIGQVVIMATGLDTRAFRLEWPPGTTVFELDAPLVLDFKDSVLAGLDATPRCARRAVAADLREDWPAALRAAGFDPSRPAAWLAEGLLVYLPDPAKGALIAAIDDLSAPGSLLAIEHAPIQSDRAGNAAYRAAGRQAALNVDIDIDTVWSEDRGYDPVAWLRNAGWRADGTPAAAAGQHYGRPLSPDSPEGMLISLLVTAGKA